MTGEKKRLRKPFWLGRNGGVGDLFPGLGIDGRWV